MSYKISAGIEEAELADWLKDAAKKFGTFPDGRVNYSQADIAPTVMCTVVCGDKFLLVKRGFGLADAEGVWSTVNGFIDEIKPVRQQAAQELSEELQLKVKPEIIKVARSYTLKSLQEKRSYIVFPCLIELDKLPEIILDSENTDFKWIKRGQLEDFDILADLPDAVDAALELL